MKRKSVLFFWYYKCLIIDIMIIDIRQKEEGEPHTPSSCDFYKLFNLSIVLSYFS